MNDDSHRPSPASFTERRLTGLADAPDTVTGHLSRPADATWARLVRGQRVTITTHDGRPVTFTVTGVQPDGDYGETYTLELAEVRQCRYCGQGVIAGRSGWRTDTGDAAGYVCEDAPRGFHGTDRN